MKVFLLIPLSLGLVAGCLAGCSDPPGLDGIPQDVNAQAVAKHPSPKNTTPKATMRAFRSDQELAVYLKGLAKEQEPARASKSLAFSVAPSPAADSAGLSRGDSVTNVQHAGVDEGGIVKVHGDHLVVLRRGRLFTVAIGDGALTPISAIDAFAPDINPLGTWYDEMLVSEDNVVVIGYSYARGGTEVGLFKIDPAGMLTYRSTYHLRSNDYYSSRNYASRLIGTKLIFYTPHHFYPGGGNPFDYFPAVRKWHKGATPGEFRRIVSADHVYRPEYPLQYHYGMALHTVTVCDLAREDLDCHAASVIGPPGRVFYVSPESVYVWVSDWVSQGGAWHDQSMVFRMPLSDTGSAPSALRVTGSPVDQFSFLESADGYLNVLIRSGGAGDGMWGAEVSSGDVALMRVPLQSFSDGHEWIPSSSYRRLPKPAGYTFENRFVGDYLLYGAGSGWSYPRNANQASLYAVPWSGGELHTISLPHGVDRIEQMGSDAVVVGTDGTNLHFTAIRLNPWPEVADDYVRRNASQGELRSHGFFYKPDTQDSGILGLPISTPGRPGYGHLFSNSAAVLFLRNDALHLEEAGELEARSQGVKDDGCRASCVDWYGNARPLFVRGRVIALLGYELVEGSLQNGRIQEMRRVSYAPERVAAFSR